MASGNRLTVVVPVYNAADETDNCLRSLRDTVGADTDVLVIDDASPDPGVENVLRSWRRIRPMGWRFTANESNLGFVGTANRGMSQCEGDVVLLNSDTVTTPGWLESLARCLESDPEIATATPWTNNGEIASLPEFCRPNPVPGDPAAVARSIAGAGQAVYPELPTAVGFCMAVSRRAIDRVGVFDEARFGKGYGEENDFSRRAAGAGMRNVLCDDAYVVHLGNRSFGPLGLKPDENSMQRLLSRHPDYLEIVQEFIRTDPLSVRRNAILSAIERNGIRLG